MIYRHYLSVKSDKNIRETITEIATENSLKFVIKSSQVNGQSQQASFFTLEGSTPRDIWRNADGLQEYFVSHCFTTTDLGDDEYDQNFILRGLGLTEFPPYNKIVTFEDSWALMVRGIDDCSTIIARGGEDLQKEFDKGFNSPEDLLIAPPTSGTWLWRGKFVEIELSSSHESYTIPQGTLVKLA